MSSFRKLPQLLAAVAVGVVGAAVAMEPAAAAGAPACPYPYVCFYSGDLENPASQITGRYQVVTSGYQSITGSSMNARAIVNTRHDDVAYLRFTDGKVVCIWPGGMYDTSNDHPMRKINGVRISSSATC
ncbi:hypothetical protein [Longispora urticae]